MTRAYVGPLPLLALGTIGELELLTSLDGPLLVPLTAREAVTSEPARTSLDRFQDRRRIRTDIPGDGELDGPAREVLGEPRPTADVRLIAAVLEHVDAGLPVGIVSDDRRVRLVARGLGAAVTGTLGVVVRAVESGLPADEGERLVRELDRRGPHLTGEVRETALCLVAEADRASG